MVVLDNISLASAGSTPTSPRSKYQTMYSLENSNYSNTEDEDEDEDNTRALRTDQQPLLSNTITSTAKERRTLGRKSVTNDHRQRQQQQQRNFVVRQIVRVLGWVWHVISIIYNRISAWLFPNEPEPLDLQSSLFFIAQVPFLLIVAMTWLPSFVFWLLGIRTSQAGDKGKGRGMRKTWSVRLALALSFLKVYLQHAEHLTIEACQARSRSIPFMTAPAGIRVNKVKIPAFPYRSRAESIVYNCLSEEERALVPEFNKRKLKKGKNSNHIQGQQDENSLSVEIQRGYDTALTSVCSIDDGDQDNNDMGQEARNRNRFYSSHHHQPEDQFAEGLDAEWLEYIGPDETHIDDSSGGSDNVAAVLYFHGGGYYTGSKEEHRVLIGPLVKRLGKNIRILIVNYRLAPQHEFPAALIDALSCYMWLLEQPISETFSNNRTRATNDSSEMTGLSNEPCFQPNQIVFMGDSAGGGLALSLSLLLRDYGELPQPLTIATWSPWLDLTQSLPSFKENALTDCIPYENFTHIHSVAVDKMFEFEEQKDCHDNNEYNSDEEHGLERGQDNDDDDDDDWELVTADEPLVRQRAQVYCPDSCLRLKYVSPLFETNFKGIPSIFITCGSAERFVNECILMASRLEQQQQPCRIDIHEDMPHIFPLFRFHPSAIAALDRTSAYIREAVKNGSSAMANNISGVGTDHGDVIIPISSTPSSLSSSSANSPLLSPKQHRQQRQQSMNQQVSVLLQSTNNNKSNTISPLGVPIVESDYDLQDKRHEPLHSSAMDRVASLSSSLDISEELLSPTSTARTNHQGLFGSSTSRVGINNKVINRSSSPRILNADDGSVSSSSPSRPPSPGRVERPNQGMTSSRKKTIVNVINLSGVSIMSYHKQVPSQSHQPLQQLQRRQRLTLKDVVTDATLYEWEVLLQQGTIPTRHWPFPPPKKA